MSNVILVTIDSLRSDHIGCYGYYKNTTPNIDSLASNGALFLQAITNGGSTPDAFPPLLASALPPLSWDEYPTIIRHNTTIAEVLSQTGYHTAAFHSNAYLTRMNGYDKGIDSFDDHITKGNGDLARMWVSKAIVSRLPFQWIRQLLARMDTSLLSISLLIGRKPFAPASQINKQAVFWLRNHSDKSFLWLHYMDGHHPYLPARKYLHELGNHPISRWQMVRLYYKMLREPDKMSPSEVENLLSLYDACIRGLDDDIGYFIEQQLGNRLGDTFVILTSDHGDQFGEHGRFGHQLSLYEGTLLVPFIIVGPGIKAGSIITEPVSHLDIAPTIVDLLGISKVDGFRGKSLKPLLMKGSNKKTKAAISTLTVPGAAGTLSTPGLQTRLIAYRTQEWKYIRTEGYKYGEAGVLLSEEVYSLKDDPGESVNLIDVQTDEVLKFKQEATDSLLQFRKAKIEQATGIEKVRIEKKLVKLSRFVKTRSGIKTKL